MKTFPSFAVVHAVAASRWVRGRFGTKHIRCRKSWRRSRCTIAATRLKRPQRKSHRGMAIVSRPPQSRGGSPSIPRSPPIAVSAIAGGGCSPDADHSYTKAVPSSGVRIRVPPREARLSQRRHARRQARIRRDFNLALFATRRFPGIHSPNVPARSFQTRGRQPRLTACG